MHAAADVHVSASRAVHWQPLCGSLVSLYACIGACAWLEAGLPRREASGSCHTCMCTGCSSSIRQLPRLHAGTARADSSYYTQSHAPHKPTA